jgi:hypothetical protein
MDAADCKCIAAATGTPIIIAPAAMDWYDDACDCRSAIASDNVSICVWRSRYCDIPAK